jgi:hypothetical protein
MTNALRKAFEVASRLPDREQDELATTTRFREVYTRLPEHIQRRWFWIGTHSEYDRLVLGSVPFGPLS